MRYISWFILVAVFFLTGCGKSTLVKTNADLTTTELEIVNGMISDVYDKVLKDRIIAHYGEKFYMLPEEDGSLAKDSPRLDKPLQTISAAYAYGTTIDISEVKFLTQAVFCTVPENGKDKKYRISEFRVVVNSVGGGMYSSSLDKLIILPLKIEITETKSSGTNRGVYPNAETTSNIVKKEGSQGEMLSDSVLGIRLEDVSEDLNYNTVTGVSTPTTLIRYSIGNMSSDQMVTFDMIEITFHAGGKQYARCTVFQLDNEAQYAVCFDDYRPEVIRPVTLRTLQSQTYNSGTGNERIVYGENQVVIKFFSGDNLVHGPFTINFTISK